MALYLTHVLFILMAYSFSWWIHYEWRIPPSLFPDFLYGMTLLMLFKLMFFKHFGLYKSLWEYASISDLVSIIKANTISELIFTPLVYFVFDFSLSIIVIDWMLSIIFIGGIRLGCRLAKNVPQLRPLSKILTTNQPKAEEPQVLQSQQTNQRRKRILILGAGAAGEMLCREIKEIPGMNNQYEVVGFIDDASHKIGRSLHGIPILGRREHLQDIYLQHKVDEVIAAIPSLNRQEIRNFLDSCNSLGIKTRTIPGIEELIEGKARLLDLREFNLDDLLRRQLAKFNEQAISQFLAGKRVLVTGAGGSIGSELCRQIIRFELNSLVMFGRGENSIFQISNELRHRDPDLSISEVIGDVINKRKLQGIFHSFRPQIVFHAGADKHVSLMELNPDEAVLNNIVGTKNLLEIAMDYNAEKVVCISTDKAVNPTSVMGCCKRICELLVQVNANGGTQPVAVRFGNVLGSRGSVVNLFQQQISRGGPVLVTHPEVARFFMSIPEAAQLVIEAGTIGAGGEIFVLDMGEQIKIADMAKDIIRLAGYIPEADIPLKFVGLRPGEKLREELAFKDERLEKTSNEKIWGIRPNGKVPLDLNQRIEELFELSLRMDFPNIVKMLKLIVPEFQPSNGIGSDIINSTLKVGGRQPLV